MISIGWYAMAEKGRDWKKVTATLTSPEIQANFYPGTKCLTFFYQLNGHNLPEKNALSAYLKLADGTFINLPFSKGGHQGNYWKRAEINLNDMKKRFQVSICSFFKIKQR